MTQTIRAAGGVVWRPAPAGGESVLVLIVHRPKYDDWTFPKGKADPGESDEECALREVEEETGLRCRMGAHLADVSYADRFGRDKIVRYWAMEPLAGEFAPNDEVDKVRWLLPAAAGALLTYDRDRALLGELPAVLE